MAESEVTSSVAVSASAFDVLSANANRRAATITNDGSANVYVKFGASASTTSYKVKLAGNEYYEFPLEQGPQGPTVYKGKVTAIGDAATGNLRVTEA